MSAGNSDKVVLVTGGAQGIGKGIAHPRVNLAVTPITTIKARTEAFRASEDRNASRIQDCEFPLLPAKGRSVTT